jgi:NAD-dependent dihydropyrimidine dehydrogenase PreA subunit
MIRVFDSSRCDECPLRLNEGCPCIESCPVDVLRSEEDGRPKVVYPSDCFSCFWCQLDCPRGAFEISAERELEIFPF